MEEHFSWNRERNHGKGSVQKNSGVIHRYSKKNLTKTQDVHPIRPREPCGKGESYESSAGNFCTHMLEAHHNLMSKHIYIALYIINTRNCVHFGLFLNQEGFEVTPLDVHNAELLNKVLGSSSWVVWPTFWDY